MKEERARASACEGKQSKKLGTYIYKNIKINIKIKTSLSLRFTFKKELSRILHFIDVPVKKQRNQNT